MGQSVPAYFNYLAVARECSLTRPQVDALESLVRQEFPEDQMMFELHMLRLLNQIRAGHLKVEEVLRPAA